MTSAVRARALLFTSLLPSMLISVAAAGLVLTPRAALADDVPVAAKKLVIVDKTAINGSAKLLLKGGDADVHAGAEGDSALVAGTLELFYADSPSNAAGLDMPAPWASNDARGAVFQIKQAPLGPSPVKLAKVVEAGQILVVAKGLGGFDLSSAPGAGGVLAVMTVTNGNDSSVHRHC
jgi:hypothetical protein